MNVSGIAEFLAVGQTGTFTAAAAALGVSVSHVSRQVSRLEERLATKLFNRNTRAVSLTPEGEALYARCSVLADELKKALQEVATAEAELDGRLRVASLTGSIADLIVAPALAELAAENPKLTIEADYSPRKVDLLREGFDIAIRSGQLADSELVITPLASRTVVTAASPDYLKAHGTPQRPEDLENHSCIITSDPAWRFCHNGEVRRQRVHARIQTNSGHGVLQAATRGLGVCHMALSGYEDTLQTGALVPILPDFWLRDVSVYAVRVNRRFVPSRTQRTLDKLRKYSALFELHEAEFLGPHAALLQGMRR